MSGGTTDSGNDSQVVQKRIVAVQESVRKELAQRLHSTVQNRLIILTLRLKQLEQSASNEEVASELSRLVTELGEPLQEEVHQIGHRLYPPILRFGLVAALQSLIDLYDGAIGIELHVDDELIRREREDHDLIHERARLSAYRIVEEALNNIVRHASAERVAISAGLSRDGELRLDVRDDGLGFELDHAAAGLGLAAMTDYAGSVGGKATIQSTPQGTEVVAKLPTLLDGECPQKFDS